MLSSSRMASVTKLEQQRITKETLVYLIAVGYKSLNVFLKYPNTH